MTSTHRRCWTEEEYDYLLNLLDTLAGANFSTTKKCIEDIHCGFIKKYSSIESPLQPEHIKRKLDNIAKTLGLKPSKLLQGWKTYEPICRKRKYYPATYGQTHEQRKEFATNETSRATRSTATLSEDVVSEEIHLDADIVPAQHSVSSLAAAASNQASPTVSEFTQDLHSGATILPVFQNSLPVNNEALALSDWEVHLIQHLRQLEGSYVYKPPLPTHAVQELLQKSMAQLSDGLVFLLLAHPTMMLTVSNLTDASRKLGLLLTDSAADQSLEQQLGCLITGPASSVRVLFRAFSAAAVYQWVLQPFNEILPQPSSSCWHSTVLSSLDICKYIPETRYGTKLTGSVDNEDTAKKMKTKWTHEYIDKVVKPKLPATANEIQTRLSQALVSLSVPPANLSQTTALQFDRRLGNISQWELLAEAAFINVLNMRADMIKCSVNYSFNFPAVGRRFDEEWMEPAHIEAGKFTEGNVVYLCLRPAVFSYDRHSANAPRVLVSRALVVIEGFVPDLTMT